MKKVWIITIFTFLFLSSLNTVNAQPIIKVDGLAKVKIGSTIQLHAWKINDCRNNINCKSQGDDITTNVNWTSSNDKIALVSKIGLVTGINEGEVLINATYIENGIQIFSTRSVIVTKEENNEKGNHGYFLNLELSDKKINYNIGDKVAISPFFCSYLNEKRTEITADGPVLIDASKVNYSLSDERLANIFLNDENKFIIEFKKEGVLTVNFSYKWGPEEYSSKVNFKIINENNNDNYENSIVPLSITITLILIILGIYTYKKYKKNVNTTQ